ncbi:unnamed protein product [Leptosia nina]|uniref:Vitellogenin domain-containing protein n=1 Tax=Leptosia nina TaxID=320188 RepID=A0AAV1JPF6_9NEOP
MRKLEVTLLLAILSSVFVAVCGFVSKSYDLETTIMVNDLIRRDKEAAYKIRAKLTIEPVWQGSGDEHLIQFKLESPQLLSRGKQVNADFLPHASIWDSNPVSIFYAHWKEGLISQCYLDLNELPDVVNYKRSIISLFQMMDGESVETDVSGTCNVTYETLSENILRKIKSNCDGEWGETRRVTRYEFETTNGPKYLARVFSEEVHEASLAGKSGLKARAWLRLEHVTTKVAKEHAIPHHKVLEEALSELTGHLEAAPLYAPVTETYWSTSQVKGENVDLEALMKDGEAVWGSGDVGAGGQVGEARAALNILDKLCVASPSRLGKLLRKLDSERLSPLVAALALCAAPRPHSAVTDLLLLHSEPPHASHPLHNLALDYLAALALAQQPHESVVEDVLKLATWPTQQTEDENSALVESALACVAACARRLRENGQDLVFINLQLKLEKALPQCKTERCRVAHLRALANLVAPTTITTLLSWAERGSSTEALTALDALESMPGSALLHPSLLNRLECIVASGRPLPVRAASLDLLLRRTADAPFGLLRLLHTLLDQGDPELLRVVWQRMESLQNHESVRTLIATLPPTLRMRALFSPGTSNVLTRKLGGLPNAPASAHIDSVQVAQGGALRRGLVRLYTQVADDIDDTLTVEVTASGLASLAGGNTEEGEEEEVGASLALSVASVRLPPVHLFRGQTELLARVWAGTASEPTRVVRALRPLPAVIRTLRLLDGSALYARNAALLSIALDAHAQVSLWSRSARAGLEARCGLAARGEMVISSAWGSLSGSADLSLEPRLRIAADLDFYNGVSLCVRVRMPEHEHAQQVALNTSLGSPPILCVADEKQHGARPPTRSRLAHRTIWRVVLSLRRKTESRSIQRHQSPTTK